MAKIAIIGTGIAGLGCAHFLWREHEVTLFEKEAHLGGHSNTVEVDEPGTGRRLPVDTGFMVFNRVTYPNLCRLFDQLEVPTKPTDMSFSVRDHRSGLEWCGSSLNHLFAQRRNLLSARFWRMLMTIDRFNREAVAAIDDREASRETVAEYVRRRGYGRDFLELYLIPMSAAVWSASPEGVLQFPAVTLLRFFYNHGFLGLHTQHQWWTVEGGAREYVRRLVDPMRGHVRFAPAAVKVERGGGCIRISEEGGAMESFDKVILATHADEALGLLADPTEMEVRLLSRFGYNHNVATLHTDRSVLPRTRRAWASWNFFLDTDADGRFAPATHYWMNSLQGVSDRADYFVSINRPDLVDPHRVLWRKVYAHPQFDRCAIDAQADLPGLNAAAAGGTETYFAGSYFGYGFHEDALASAVSLAALLLQRDPWSADERPLEGTDIRAIRSGGVSC